MFKRTITSIFFMAWFSLETIAQCPMCKASVESNLEAGNSNAVGLGLNTGILYLMAVPYIMVMVIGLLWYRARKKQQLNAPRFS